MRLKKLQVGGFPGGPVIKTLPSSAGCVGSVQGCSQIQKNTC